MVEPELTVDRSGDWDGTCTFRIYKHGKAWMRVLESWNIKHINNLKWSERGNIGNGLTFACCCWRCRQESKSLKPQIQTVAREDLSTWWMSIWQRQRENDLPNEGSEGDRKDSVEIAILPAAYISHLDIDIVIWVSSGASWDSSRTTSPLV